MSSAAGPSQEKLQMSETPEIKLPENLKIEDVKAICEEGKQKCEEFRELIDISHDLEAYAHENSYSLPPELKQFRDDFKNFDESVRQIQKTLDSSGSEVNIEVLSEMYRAVVGGRRKLDVSRERYRNGALVDHMDINWVDGEGKLAVGGAPKEVKALKFAVISVVVDLREQCGNKAVLQSYNIELLHHPIEEFKKAPSLEFLKGIAERDQ